MDNFTQLDYNINIDKLKEDAYNIIFAVGWGDLDQICLTHPLGKPDWFSGVGGMVVPTDHSELNEKIHGTYLEQVYRMVKNDYPCHRVRLMKLEPKKCMSFHTDVTQRIHIPVTTNEKSMMVIKEEVKHMEQGTVWLTNTTRPHTAFNADTINDRVHILFDLI